MGGNKMKKLNVYGEEFIEKVKEEGRLEDINDYYQVDNIAVTQSQTNHLINLTVVTHSEEIYLYNNKKYKLDTFREIDCNEIFTIPFSRTNDMKKDLIDNFVNTMYSNIYNYELKEITENEYNNSNDISKEEVKNKLKNAIL